jgi:hypothetical protein
MRRIVPLAVIAALAAGAAAASPGLVERHSKLVGYSVSLPAGWTYQNATYPSDHSTEFWRDPHDRNAKLEVQDSACVGCVQPQKCIVQGKGPCGPRPENLLPKNAVWHKKLDRWTLRFRAPSQTSPYPDEGLVVVLHRGNDIQGFIYAELWLPAARRSLAYAILATFKPPLS